MYNIIYSGNVHAIVVAHVWSISLGSRPSPLRYAFRRFLIASVNCAAVRGRETSTLEGAGMIHHVGIDKRPRYILGRQEVARRRVTASPLLSLRVEKRELYSKAGVDDRVSSVYYAPV